MIDALAGIQKPAVEGLLLDRHVAVASLETFKHRSLEIGRVVDYDYFIGMSVRPPQNATQICEMVKKCTEDLVNSERFELTALKVSWRKLRNAGTKKPVAHSKAVAAITCAFRHVTLDKGITNNQNLKSFT